MMEAGSKLDALVAEKVMGWHADSCENQWLNKDGSGTNVFMCTVRDEYGSTIYPCWSPSTSIADAWEVVEKLRWQGLLVCLYGVNAWNITISKVIEGSQDESSGFICQAAETVGHGYADTAPLAICLAALKATEKRVE